MKFLHDIPDKAYVFGLFIILAGLYIWRQDAGLLNLLVMAVSGILSLAGALNGRKKDDTSDKPNS